MEFIGEPEVAFGIVTTTRAPSILWPIGLLMTLGALVAIGIGSAGASEDGAAAQDAPSAIDSKQPIPHVAGLGDSPSPLIVLIPWDGQIILGSSIPVAGRLTPHGRVQRSADADVVRVLVLDGEMVLGAGEIPIVNGVFAGCITIGAPPATGRAVRMSVMTADLAGHAHAAVVFVLGPESSERTPVSCASDPGSDPGDGLRSDREDQGVRHLAERPG
jgi:hypothetical protein